MDLPAPITAKVRRHWEKGRRIVGPFSCHDRQARITPASLRRLASSKEQSRVDEPRPNALGQIRTVKELPLQVTNRVAFDTLHNYATQAKNPGFSIFSLEKSGSSRIEKVSPVWHPRPSGLHDVPSHAPLRCL